MTNALALSPASPCTPRKGTGGLSAAIWLAGLVVLLLWSLISWAAALILTGGGDFLTAQAAVWSVQYPEVDLAVSTAAAWLAHFGTALLWLAWAIGAVMIVFGAWLCVRFVRALERGFDRLAPHASAAWSSARGHPSARGRTEETGAHPKATPSGTP
jgi:hypothetical protein